MALRSKLSVTAPSLSHATSAITSGSSPAPPSSSPRNTESPVRGTPGYGRSTSRCHSDTSSWSPRRASSRMRTTSMLRATPGAVWDSGRGAGCRRLRGSRCRGATAPPTQRPPSRRLAADLECGPAAVDVLPAQPFRIRQLRVRAQRDGVPRPRAPHMPLGAADPAAMDRCVLPRSTYSRRSHSASMSRGSCARGPSVFGGRASMPWRASAASTAFGVQPTSRAICADERPSMTYRCRSHAASSSGHPGHGCAALDAGNRRARERASTRPARRIACRRVA